MRTERNHVITDDRTMTCVVTKCLPMNAEHRLMRTEQNHVSTEHRTLTPLGTERRPVNAEHRLMRTERTAFKFVLKRWN